MSELQVRGEPTTEELAALLAVVSARDGATAPRSGYARWRRTRLAALRRTAGGSDGRATTDRLR